MTEQKFIDDHIQGLLADPAIGPYFARARTKNERELMQKGLEQSLGEAYKKYARDYFESKGWKTGLANVVRYASSASDVLGTYLFWTMGGAGFGFKGLGLAGKSLADILENSHYETTRHADSTLDKYVTKDGLKIAAEGAGQLGAAYLPVGGELWAFLRGTKKYDEKITDQAITHAKLAFVKQFGTYNAQDKQPVPLEQFVEPHYVEPHVVPAGHYQMGGVPNQLDYEVRDGLKVVPLQKVRESAYAR